LRLNGAVIVQTLQKSHIERFVASGGKSLEGLAVALQEADGIVLELLQTPLMLGVAMIAYRDFSFAEVQSETSIVKRREQLFHRFVEALLNRSAGPSRFGADRARHWLSALAFFLVKSKQPAFRTDIDLGDLTSVTWRAAVPVVFAIDMLVWMASGFEFQPVVLLLFGPLVALALLSLIIALLLPLIMLLTASARIRHRKPSWRPALMSIAYWMIQALVGTGFGRNPTSITLWLFGFTPFVSSTFFEYSVAHLLLRRSGDGYIFTHRFLMEYFASFVESDFA
jgi:hypothetical protein